MNIKFALLKFGTIGTGYTINFIIGHWFDILIYIPVVMLMGPYIGCGVMIVLSMILNLTLIWLYDRTGKDWLGLEFIKEGKKSAALPTWLLKVIAIGDVAAFIGLTAYDPFLATIYLRKPECAFKGLSSRDWKIFLFSTLFSNIGWTGFVYLGILIAKSFH